MPIDEKSKLYRTLSHTLKKNQTDPLNTFLL